MINLLKRLLGKLVGGSVSQSNENDRDSMPSLSGVDPIETSPENPLTSDELVAFDEDLLEKSRTQWQFGDWETLITITREQLQHHPDRAKIALLVAAGHSQCGDIDRSRQFTRLAEDWGCSRRLVTRILASGVHFNLGKAALLAGSEKKCRDYLQKSVEIGDPRTDVSLLAEARFNWVKRTISDSKNTLTQDSNNLHVTALTEEDIREIEGLRKKVFWWFKSPNIRNVGDELGPLIVKWLLEQKGIDIESCTPTARLLTVGSIIHFAKDQDCIWGSGVNGKIRDLEKYNVKSLDIRSVRGPLTRNFLVQRGFKVPEVYGDPGLLASKVWPYELERQNKKSVDFVVIPHLSENLSHYKKKYGSQRVLSVMLEPSVFIERLVSAEIVISASLHGLVLSDAYALKSAWLKTSINETEFKYVDYYLGTGRLLTPKSFLRVEDALLNDLALGLSVNDVNCLQDQLIKSFPYSIWES